MAITHFKRILQRYIIKDDYIKSNYIINYSKTTIKNQKLKIKSSHNIWDAKNLGGPQFWNAIVLLRNTQHIIFWYCKPCNWPKLPWEFIQDNQRFVVGILGKLGRGGNVSLGKEGWMVGKVGFGRVGTVRIDGIVGFGNVGNDGKGGSVGFGKVGMIGSVGFGRVGIVGKGGIWGSGNVGKGGSVGFGKVGIIGSVGFERVGIVGIGGNVGFGNVGNDGKGGSVSFGKVGITGNVGFGRVGGVGKGGSIGLGNVGNEGKGGNVGLGNVGMTGKVGIAGWLDCKRWQAARLTSMFEMNIAMNKTKMKHLKDAITIGVLLCVNKKCILYNNKGGYGLGGVTMWRGIYWGFSQ